MLRPDHRSPPVEEVIQDGVNGRLVDFFDVDGWAEALIDSLAAPARDDALRIAARRTVVERYDLQSYRLPNQLDWPVGLASWIGQLDWPVGLDRAPARQPGLTRDPRMDAGASSA